MFVAGVAMIAIGLAMIVAGTFVPVARLGLIGGGIGVLLAGALNAYLGAPSRPAKAPEGMRKAKATILDATALPEQVAGYRMVELTLELQPKGGIPTQVKRKFSSGRLGRIEPGRKLDVFYDPADPRKIELA